MYKILIIILCIIILYAKIILLTNTRPNQLHASVRCLAVAINAFLQIKPVIGVVTAAGSLGGLLWKSPKTNNGTKKPEKT